MNSSNQNQSNKESTSQFPDHNQTDWLDHLLSKKETDILDHGFTRSVMHQVEQESAKQSHWKKPFILTTAIFLSSCLSILIAPDAFADAYRHAEVKLIAVYAYLSQLGLLQFIVFSIVITFFITFGLSTLSSRGSWIKNRINSRE